MSDFPDPHEQVESAQHVAEAHSHGGANAALVPLSIAIMAVIAAVFGGLETTWSSHAVLARSSAAVRQGEASDLWAFFQARSIKKNMYEIAAAQSGDGGPALAAKAEQYAAQEAELEKQARAKEEQVKEAEKESDEAMERHHRLTSAVNIVHLAIALASISILIRRRWLWMASLLVVVGGAVVGVIGVL
jgi:hypothetical protein